MSKDKIISREELEQFLYCSLSYRYRYDLDIPYTEQDKNLLFVKGAQHAVSSWFDSVAKGVSRKRARNRMGLRLDTIWRNLGFQAEDFPMAHSTIMQILLELESNFSGNSDLVVGGGLTTTMPLNGWGITDLFSGLYIKKGQRTSLTRSKRPIVGVQVAPDSSIDKLPSLNRLRLALARYTLNTAGKDALGSGHPPQLMVIYTPSMKKRTYELQHEDFRETTWLTSSVLRALDEQAYLPTDSLNKCRSCWYKHKCSNYFCIPEPSPQKVARLLQ